MPNRLESATIYQFLTPPHWKTLEDDVRVLWPGFYGQGKEAQVNSSNSAIEAHDPVQHSDTAMTHLPTSLHHHNLKGHLPPQVLQLNLKRYVLSQSIIHCVDHFMDHKPQSYFGSPITYGMTLKFVSPMCEPKNEEPQCQPQPQPQTLPFPDTYCVLLSLWHRHVISNARCPR
jgi:hypothetical protein